MIPQHPATAKKNCKVKNQSLFYRYAQRDSKNQKLVLSVKKYWKKVILVFVFLARQGNNGKGGSTITFNKTQNKSEKKN